MLIDIEIRLKTRTIVLEMNWAEENEWYFIRKQRREQEKPKLSVIFFMPRRFFSHYRCRGLRTNRRMKNWFHPLATASVFVISWRHFSLRKLQPEIFLLHRELNTNFLLPCRRVELSDAIVLFYYYRRVNDLCWATRVSRQDCKISIVRFYANINRKRFYEILSRNCMSKNLTWLTGVSSRLRLMILIRVDIAWASFFLRIHSSKSFRNVLFIFSADSIRLFLHRLRRFSLVHERFFARRRFTHFLCINSFRST